MECSVPGRSFPFPGIAWKWAILVKLNSIGRSSFLFLMVKLKSFLSLAADSPN